MSVAVAWRIRSGGALQFLVVNPAIPHNSRHPALVSEWNLNYLLCSLQPSQNIIFLGLLQATSSLPLSSRCGGDRPQQGVNAIPQNLDADANEKKGREPQDITHPAFSVDSGEPAGQPEHKHHPTP